MQAHSYNEILIIPQHDYVTVIIGMQIFFINVQHYNLLHIATSKIVYIG